MFCSLERAASIEAAEVDLLRAFGSAAERRHPGTVRSQPIGQLGAALFAGEHSPLNKIIGVGFEPLDVASMGRAERLFAGVDAPCRVELPTMVDPEVLTALHQRGYRLTAFENVYGRSLDDVSAPDANELEVGTVGAVECSAWVDVLADGFLAPDGQGVPSTDAFTSDLIRTALGSMAETAGVDRYLVRRGDSVLGGGAMRCTGAVAMLCGAATRVEHRRQGVQRALLMRRLADAQLAGCELAVMNAQPGSKSAQNAARQGFALLYARAVMVRGE